jgi:hypothetical protein
MVSSSCCEEFDPRPGKPGLFPGCGAPPVEAGRAAARLELGVRVVKCIVEKLMGNRQNASIEKDDLLQEGYVEMLCTLDREPPVNGFPLDKRIARNVSTQLYRYINKLKREYRYAQRGSQKAIRDADVGNQAGGVDGRILEDCQGWASAKIAPSVKNHDFPNCDNFIYRGWLRGAVSVIRDETGYSPKELGEIEFYIRPVLDALVAPRYYSPDPHTAAALPGWGFSSRTGIPTHYFDDPLGVRRSMYERHATLFSRVDRQEELRHLELGVTWFPVPKLPGDAPVWCSGLAWLRLGVKPLRCAPYRPEDAREQLNEEERRVRRRWAGIVRKWGATIGPVRAGSVWGLPDYGAEHGAWDERSGGRCGTEFEKVGPSEGKINFPS